MAKSKSWVIGFNAKFQQDGKHRVVSYSGGRVRRKTFKSWGATCRYAREVAKELGVRVRFIG